jgi:hypothetical protein
MAVSLALLVQGAGLACSPAAPMDLGTEYTDVDPPEGDLPSGTEVDGDGSQLPPPLYDPLVESSQGSQYCRQAFTPCGGVLAGTWVVEDTCGAETRNRKALQMWGQSLMNLDSEVCGDAPRRLTSRWSGQLTFDGGKAVDERVRWRTLDVDLNLSCLSASVGLHEMASNAAAVCESLQDQTTTCALVSGVCRCSTRVSDSGKVSGIYGVLEGRVAIEEKAEEPVEIYDYCVTEGDRLLWHERGSATPVVLYRLEPGTSPDPVGFPR